MKISRKCDESTHANPLDFSQIIAVDFQLVLIIKNDIHDQTKRATRGQDDATIAAVHNARARVQNKCDRAFHAPAAFFFGRLHNFPMPRMRELTRAPFRPTGGEGVGRVRVEAIEVAVAWVTPRADQSLTPKPQIGTRGAKGKQSQAEQQRAQNGRS